MQLAITTEYQAKLNQGIDLVLNSQANCLVMGVILTSDNAGIIPSRSAYRDDSEVIL